MEPLLPASDCSLCPRLVAFRQANKQAYPNFYNGTVPSFGDLEASLLVVGLAPGLKGANATGRPFTGDYAGDVLYEALQKCGLSTGNYGARADDGFTLRGVRITNAARCVPPENKPTPAEVKQCNGFLRTEIMAMPALKAILCLGQTSHNAVLKAVGAPLKLHPFGHATHYQLSVNGRSMHLFSSYHTSRYNINTGRLNREMFLQLLQRTQSLIA